MKTERTIELYKEACEFAYQICRNEGREGGSYDHVWLGLCSGRFAELIYNDIITVVAAQALSNHSALDVFKNLKRIYEGIE